MTRVAVPPGGRAEAPSREPLTRTERLFVTMFVTMFATTLGAGAVGFTALSSQMLDLQEQMLGFQEQMGSRMLGFQEQMGGQMLDLQEQMLDLQEQMGSRMLDLQKQIGELSERMSRVETLIETHLVPPPGAPSASSS